MKNMFISLEGISAVGKTTIGKILSEKLAGVFYKTPSGIFHEIRAKIDEETNTTSRFLFYLSAIIHSSKEIEKIINTSSVVCDRYIHTTICSHKALGVNTELIDRWAFDNVMLPDYVFLIVCDEQIRRKRLKARGLTHNDLIDENPKIKKMYLKNYDQYNLIKIDNSEDNPELAVQKIISIIEKQ